MVPKQFGLKQNYPNPFNPITNISFSLPTSERVRISVFDMRGRRIDTIVDESYGPGTHAVTWDATPFASGVYFYVIQAGKHTETKKLTLVK